MTKVVVYVEFVGLDQAYEAAYSQSIRKIICAHRSEDYVFVDWSESAADFPDISIVAVDKDHSWQKVRDSANRCHSLNIGLLGASHPLLGFPVIRLLRDLADLVPQKPVNKKVEYLRTSRFHARSDAMTTVPVDFSRLRAAA